MNKFFLILKIIWELWPYIKKLAEAGKDAQLEIRRRRRDNKIVAVFKENRDGDQSIEDTANRADRLNRTHK